MTYKSTWKWVLRIVVLCQLSGCRTEDRSISNFLRRETEKKGIDYGLLLTQSYRGDSLSIIKISTLKFGNSANFENGSNLLEIFDSVGEGWVAEMIKNCSIKEKTLYFITCLLARISLGTKSLNSNGYTISFHALLLNSKHA
jgi:hypothetical protein